MYRDTEQRDFARQLRNQATEPEKRLWWFLRAEKLGCKFRRQAAIGPYIVDFVCFAQRLVVELDGPQHLEADARAHDAHRTEWLAERGFRVLRFRNHEVDEDVQDVVRRIVEVLKSGQPPSPALPAAGEEAGQR